MDGGEERSVVFVLRAESDGAATRARAQLRFSCAGLGPLQEQAALPQLTPPPTTACAIASAPAPFDNEQHNPDSAAAGARPPRASPVFCLRNRTTVHSNNNTKKRASSSFLLLFVCLSRGIKRGRRYYNIWIAMNMGAHVQHAVRCIRELRSVLSVVRALCVCVRGRRQNWKQQAVHIHLDRDTTSTSPSPSPSHITHHLSIITHRHYTSPSYHIITRAGSPRTPPTRPRGTLPPPPRGRPP